MNQKLCNKCGEIRSYDDFWKDKNRSDGLNSTCKFCRKAWDSSERGRKSDAIRGKKYRESKKGQAVIQRRLSSPNGKLIVAKKDKRYRENNPKKCRAKQVVNNAVKRGDLPKVSTLKCHDCGNKASQYHHHSYEVKYWLDVIPLCKKCHTNKH